MGLLAWTKESDHVGSGVDHLGMRVAGEVAYSSMIDFNTTVSWRPRYYSFFCWLARHAFIKAGGNPQATKNEIDRREYLQTLKRIEYAVASSTLLSNENELRIAGSININNYIYDLKKNGITKLKFKSDHLKASNGGLSVYAGPMRALNLMASASGVDVPLPFSIGDKLADSFENTISQNTKIKEIFEADGAPIDALIEIGQYCSLCNICGYAQKNEKMNEELQLLRSVIIDWENFKAGKGPSGRRILSIGLILGIRKALAEEPSSLLRFQEFLFLESIIYKASFKKLELPGIYNEVIKEWQNYLLHSYTTYSLEALLGVLLSLSFELQREIGEKLSRKVLIDYALDMIKEGFEESSIDLPTDLEGWWLMPLSDLKRILEGFVSVGRNAPVTEPDLMNSIKSETKNIDTANMNAWMHDAALMFVYIQVRQLLFYEKYGNSYWLGNNESFRLPPLTLENIFRKHLSGDGTVKEFLFFVCEDLVLKQHDQNALRKLTVQPKQDTVKFVKQGNSFIPLSTHEPGTSNPRYANTVFYLQDLGYLTYSDKPVPTPEGESTLQKIEAISL